MKKFKVVAAAEQRQTHNKKERFMPDAGEMLALINYHYCQASEAIIDEGGAPIRRTVRVIVEISEDE